MFRKVLFTLGATLALTTQPLAGQDQVEKDPFAELSEMFEVEPLTTEQEARLPLAQEIVGKMIPDGAMREMMDGMMGGMFGEMLKMGAVAGSTEDFVAGRLGLGGSDLSLSEDQADELANMFDSARVERKEREAQMMPEFVGQILTLMEPTMRKAMSELYAVHFTQSQLQDIDGFFSTQTGSLFARKSFSMASDPRMIAASMESLPLIMGEMGAIEQKIKDATVDLPAARSWAELTDAERARISTLTGYSQEDLDDWSSSSGDDDWGAEADVVEGDYEVSDPAY